MIHSIEYLLICLAAACNQPAAAPPGPSPAPRDQPATTTQPVESPRFKVLHVQGNVRYGEPGADPLEQEDWRPVQPDEILPGQGHLLIGLRGRLKLTDVNEEVPTVLLFDRATVLDLSQLQSSSSSSTRLQLNYSDRPTHCRMHGTQMHEGQVPVRGGMHLHSLVDRSEQIARAHYFPWANSYYEPEVLIDVRKTARVRYCTKCREVETRWNSLTPEERKKEFPLRDGTYSTRAKIKG